ncbi:hypothetical protein [Asticcacaulis endophyticus]|uniref:Uncharacterized protein n=1 Tax=Asticcacaulis endophyticus TaxID=1395890 RepID=A0A918PUF6_9CAUL|nr:hypothetical protein [Asticcacaulis endophyticus]GGZ21610.1 hypothetical protein GCM10011273_02940 [Asticcacaulis endophyticus]
MTSYPPKLPGKGPPASLADTSRDLDEEIQRLVKKYGKPAVVEALKKNKQKRGPKTRTDWKFLAPIFRIDAVDFIEGRNPFELRTNYKIANFYAEKQPGHSPISTFRRLLRDLKEGRPDRVYLKAYFYSEVEYPYETHIKTLNRIIKALPSAEHWPSFLEISQHWIDDHVQRIGPIPPHFTMKEIREAVLKQPVNYVLEASKASLGLFGSAYLMSNKNGD